MRSTRRKLVGATRRCSMPGTRMVSIHPSELRFAPSRVAAMIGWGRPSRSSTGIARGATGTAAGGSTRSAVSATLAPRASAIGCGRTVRPSVRRLVARRPGGRWERAELERGASGVRDSGRPESTLPGRRHEPPGPQRVDRDCEVVLGWQHRSAVLSDSTKESELSLVQRAVHAQVELPAMDWTGDSDRQIEGIEVSQQPSGDAPDRGPFR